MKEQKSLIVAISTKRWSHQSKNTTVRNGLSEKLFKWKGEEMRTCPKLKQNNFPTLQINCSTNQEEKKGHVLLCDNHMAKGIPGLL